MGNKNLIITIEREYGSGGRIVGRKLAEELGLHFYDDEILKMASEKSAVGEEFFRLADEKAGNNLLHRLTGAKKADVFGKPSLKGDVTSPDNLFKFQAMVMRELAEQEPCVFVGRAAGSGRGDRKSGPHLCLCRPCAPRAARYGSRLHQ